MANCNCNKCNPTRDCGCADSPERTPCTYSDCSVGSESCSDVHCAECVSYCGTTFQIGGVGTLIKIETGERLDSVIQKLAVMLSSGVGACTSDDLHHAPYNAYATEIGRDTITVVWNGESVWGVRTKNVITSNIFKHLKTHMHQYIMMNGTCRFPYHPYRFFQ